MTLKDFKTRLRKEQISLLNLFLIQIDKFKQEDIEEVYNRYESGDRFEKEINEIMQEGNNSFIPDGPGDKNILYLISALFEDKDMIYPLWEIMTRIGSEGDRIGVYCKNSKLRAVFNLFSNSQHIDEFFNYCRLALYDGMKESDMQKLQKHFINDLQWSDEQISELNELIEVRR